MFFGIILVAAFYCINGEIKGQIERHVLDVNEQISDTISRSFKLDQVHTSMAGDIDA